MYPGGGSSWSSRGGFRGGRGGRGGGGNGGGGHGGGGWGGQRPSRGTGANDTPLGTPSRMSPVTQSTTPPAAPVKEVLPAVESSNDSCNGKKRKSMGSEDTVVRVFLTFSCWIDLIFRFLCRRQQMAILRPTTKEQKSPSRLRDVT